MEYKSRRNLIAKIGVDFKMGEEVPSFEYSEREQSMGLGLGQAATSPQVVRLQRVQLEFQDSDQREDLQARLDSSAGRDQQISSQEE
jgi:hypothetical protein